MHHGIQKLQVVALVPFCVKFLLVTKILPLTKVTILKRQKHSHRSFGVVNILTPEDKSMKENQYSYSNMHVNVKMLNW